MEVLDPQLYIGSQIRSHHNLDAWQKAVDIVVEIYRITETFPKDERFGLISQVRRASVSIAANIAEGAGGSASEVETELIIAYRLGFLSEMDQRKLVADLDDIGRMITGLSNYLKRKIT